MRSASAEWQGVMEAEDPRPPRPDPRPLLLRQREAAEALSMSEDSLVRHVLPHLRTVRCGRMRLIPARELERWIDARATLVGGR